MRYRPNVQAPRRTGAFTLIPLALFARGDAGLVLGGDAVVAAHLGYQPRLGDRALLDRAL